MRRGRVFLVACGVELLLACGSSEAPPPATLGAAGTGGSLGVISGGSGGGGGVLTAFAGMTGIGAFAGYLNVHPPATVDLLACANIVEASADFAKQCSSCCNQKDFVSYALFDGKCVCGSPKASGATPCASRADLFECTNCCIEAGYRNSNVNLSVQNSCLCYSHYNTQVCSQALVDAFPRNACAVCCINAGYINSEIDFGCACMDG
jgi:hypothetical protein